MYFQMYFFAQEHFQCPKGVCSVLLNYTLQDILTSVSLGNHKSTPTNSCLSVQRHTTSVHTFKISSSEKDVGFLDVYNSC